MMNWMIVIVVMIFLRVYGICSTGEDNDGDEVDENDIQCSSASLSRMDIIFIGG